MTFLDALRRAGELPEIPIRLEHSAGGIVRMSDAGELYIGEDEPYPEPIHWLRFTAEDEGWSVVPEVDPEDDEP